MAQAGININSIKEQYGKLTMRIEKLSKQQGLGASLRRSLAVKGATLHARLGLTCKTIKSQAKWNTETSTNAADGFWLASALGSQMK